MRESNDFLFVFISTGDIFVLETQSETYVEPTDVESNKIIHKLSHGKVPKFAYIDVKQKANQSGIDSADQLYILSVDETGREGKLHLVTITDPKPMNYGQSKKSMHKRAFDIKQINVFQVAKTD